MTAPGFTPGLPPDGAEGLFLGTDGEGNIYLLRWISRHDCFSAIGWESYSEPMPVLHGLTVENAGLIVAHAPVAPVEVRADGVREALDRVTGLLDTWASDHPDERTAEIDAAVFCARQILRFAPAALESAPAQPVREDETTQCDRCQGNGEIVTDWDRYRHPHEGDVGDEAVAECPDCNGEGQISAQPVREGQEGKAEPVAWQWRSRIKGGAWDAWEQGRYGGEAPPFMEIEERLAPALAYRPELVAEIESLRKTIAAEAQSGENWRSECEFAEARAERAEAKLASLGEALETAVDAMQFYMLPNAMDGGIGECAAISNTKHALEIARAALSQNGDRGQGEGQSAEIARLTAALREAQAWHLAEQEGLSKSARDDREALWRRQQHVAQAEAIEDALRGEAAS